MARVYGSVVDITGYTMAQYQPVLTFTPSSGVLYENNLIPDGGIPVIPDALGNWVANFVPGTRTHPASWLTPTVTWLDSAGNFVKQDSFPGIRIVVPEQGGAVKDLLVTSPNPRAVYKGTTTPQVPSDWQFTYNPVTGVLMEWSNVLETHVFLAELKGPKGLDAVGAGATDAAISGFLDDTETETYDAAARVVSESIGRDVVDHSSNANSTTLGKWRTAMVKQAGGERQARLVVHSDSSGQGAGAGSPYVTSAWPGRLARLFAEKYGRVGSGVMPLWHYYGTSGAALNQPSISFAGNVTDANFGVYGRGAKKFVRTGTTWNYTHTSEYCDAFRVHLLNSAPGTKLIAEIDGSVTSTIKGSTSTTGVDINPLTGYASSQIVTEIPAGSAGKHTLRLRIDGADGAEAFITQVEPILKVGYGVAVSNVALSGITTDQLYLDDGVNGNSGMSVSMDATRGDGHIIAVQTNDWQGHIPIATFKSRLTTAVRRTKTSTPVANGGTTSNGDCLIVLNQWVDTTTYPADLINSPAFTAYLAAATEVAIAEGAAIVDLTELATNFADWNSKGYAADGLHPSSRGHEAIAQALFRVLDQF